MRLKIGFGPLFYVYTVNRLCMIERLIRWGVDGIISDYPDYVIRVREEVSRSQGVC